MRDKHPKLLEALGLQRADETGTTDTGTNVEAGDPLAQERVKAAREVGLPDQLADGLKGTTPAGIMADAMRVARELKPKPVNEGELRAIEAKANKVSRDTENLLPGSARSEAEGRRFDR